MVNSPAHSILLGESAGMRVVYLKVGFCQTFPIPALLPLPRPNWTTFRDRRASDLARRSTQRWGRAL